MLIKMRKNFDFSIYKSSKMSYNKSNKAHLCAKTLIFCPFGGLDHV